MVENIIRHTSKKTWYKWSVYINIVLFFVAGLFIYFLMNDSIAAGCERSSRDWMIVSRDVAVIAIVGALIFYQFFRNLFTIMKRSL